MKTLTIEHLAGYLPYGLKIQSRQNGICELAISSQSMGNLKKFNCQQVIDLELKPILHPLSDLTEKELRENGFWHHIDFLTVEKGMPIHAPYEMVVYLFSKHYDVFELIEQDLAIDINTLNPK